ncbi:MAG: hypothetical protein NW216_13330 [Hyphomicrobium sp.]|nr:hypothetical protein [Hyphomicrobium sp.]
MRVTSTIAQGIAVMVFALVAGVLPAAAQGMTPMRGEIKSFTDRFAVRVFPMNPYGHRVVVEVKVYDETFAPVAAQVSPASAVLGPDDNRSVMVVIPFDGKTERRVRICTEAVPFKNQNTRVRAQVCGRFLGRRVG